MNNPDTSSAEWIAESPSTTTPQPGVYQTLPLANFGKTTFTATFATADGHTGSISDPRWSAAQVQLTPASNFSDPSAGGSLAGRIAGGFTVVLWRRLDRQRVR
jgi:hypothetical protein